MVSVNVDILADLPFRGTGLSLFATRAGQNAL